MAVQSLVLAAHVTQPGTATTVSVGSLFIQLVIALAVILALIALVARVMRGRVGAIRRSGGPLAVLGRQPLGKGVQVAVVRAGAVTYVLGITSNHVTRIGRYIEQPEEPDEIGEYPSASGTPLGWRSSLGQLRERTVRRA